MSGGSPPPAPETWKMPGLDQAATQAQGAGNTLTSLPNWANQAAGGFSGLMQGPVASQTSYNPQQTVDYGMAISQMPQQYMPYLNQIMNTGFDPQNEIYGRASHDLTQQVRSGMNQRGITMSPYGAGIENDALGNFNLDWQNAQLGRQATALGAALPGYAQAGQQMGYGQQVAQQGPGFQADMYGALGSLGQQSIAQPQAAMNGWLNYLGQGNNNQQLQLQSYQQQLAAYQQKQQEEAALWSGLGSLAGTAVGAFAGPGGAMLGSQIGGSLGGAAAGGNYAKRPGN